MSDRAIRVQNISKLYRIGRHALGKNLREMITEVLAAPFRRRIRTADDETAFWALRDVSFEVEHGEVVGIIGRNGSGKSTLLKILSRITEPTEGHAEIHGRVGSLLEVGTGFHPELTGRENIYMNGAILGMSRAEISRKFDEIVAFSEVEQFLDTPVKRYSSGMYIRLAFAVAAHLETDILIVDEVLAVGDAAFQKKCLGKMGDLARGGRTVLFVSHNLGSVAALCSRTALIDSGHLEAIGTSKEIIAQYLRKYRTLASERSWATPHDAPGNHRVRLHAVRLRSEDQVTTEVDIQRESHVEIDYWNLQPDAAICVSIHVINDAGVCVFATANMRSANLIEDPWFNKPYPTGLYRSVCTIPGNFLNEGQYQITAFVLTDIMNIEVRVDEALAFTVYETGGMRAEFSGGWDGVVRPRFAWTTAYLGPLPDMNPREAPV